MWRVSPGLNTIIPSFAGFHEKGFTLNSRLSVLPSIERESDLASGCICKMELNFLEQSLSSFHSLGVYLTAENIYSALLLLAASFAEEVFPNTHRGGRPVVVQHARGWMNKSAFFCGLALEKPLLTLLYTLSGVHNNGEIPVSICLTSVSFSQLVLNSSREPEGVFMDPAAIISVFHPDRCSINIQ